ncbi:fatty acyl-AMP ligase [Phenylobacterium sp.]|uniref:fatty acyl-AMP ligase n=1 Tax=Phenylobacterium sp. TaxID=1871053 RepID=UPI0035AF826F
MTPTPTDPDRELRLGFSTLIEALEFAATRLTGVNLYDQRGKLALALPYATLRDEAQALARRLLASGLARGERVGLVADTDAEFVRLFFACQYAGLIPAPLPLPAPLAGRQAWIEQIARLLSSAGAKAVFGPESLLPWLGEAAAEAGLRAPVPSTELPDGDAELPPIGPDDACYVQFSSGSTRNPTGVLVTHKALMANALAITRDGLQVQPKDRAVSWLPLYHDMGLIGFLLSPLASQMTVDLLPTAAFVRRPLIWLDLITKNGGTISYSPTFGYELCARRADTADISAYDLSGWRIAGSGGDMVRPGPLRAFAERFAEVGFRAEAFVASYGMAEATLALTMAPLGRGVTSTTVDVERMENEGVVAPAAGRRAREFVSCGPVLPHHELEVRGTDGRPLPEGRVGRVFVRGPSIMTGYLNQPEATAAVLDADGWLDTGDLGFLAEGAFTPTGRAKDLILLNGRNIWPQDLEWTAEAEVERLRSGDVAAFAVERDGDDEIVVLVQARSSDPEVRQALTDDVAAVLRARHAVEARVELVGAHALPQTSSGKLSRSKARTLYLAGAFHSVEPA